MKKIIKYTTYPDTTLMFRVDTDSKSLMCFMPDEFADLYDISINEWGELVIIQNNNN
ncbi:MAG: hypothetical protein MJ245_02985 [Clostridia bacterium]|nr:hypothetical protein [Clostridia bacterium]